MATDSLNVKPKSSWRRMMESNLCCFGGFHDAHEPQQPEFELVDMAQLPSMRRGHTEVSPEYEAELYRRQVARMDRRNGATAGKYDPDKVREERKRAADQSSNSPSGRVVFNGLQKFPQQSPTARIVDNESGEDDTRDIIQPSPTMSSKYASSMDHQAEASTAFSQASVSGPDVGDAREQDLASVVNDRRSTSGTGIEMPSNAGRFGFMPDSIAQRRAETGSKMDGGLEEE